MKIKMAKFNEYLSINKMTVQSFAQEAEIEVSEIERLLNGDAVGENTARKFILYLGADTAQGFIDWKAIGKVNPFACEADDSSEV